MRLLAIRRYVGAIERSGRITTHYSAAELSRLLEAANSVCDTNEGQPELLVMRGALQGGSRKNPATAKVVLRAIV